MDFVLAGLLRREADTLAAAKMKQGQGLKALLEHREPDPEIYEQSTEIDEPRARAWALLRETYRTKGPNMIPHWDILEELYSAPERVPSAADAGGGVAECSGTAAWLRKHGRRQSSKLTKQQRTELRECFNLIDSNGGGTLSLAEVHEAFEYMGLRVSSNHLKKVLDSLDLDGTGELEYEEFVQLMTQLEENPEVKPKRMDRVQGEEEDDAVMPIPPVPFPLLATAYRRRKMIDAITSEDQQLRSRMYELNHAASKQVEEEQYREELLASEELALQLSPTARQSHLSLAPKLPSISADVHRVRSPSKSVGSDGNGGRGSLASAPRRSPTKNGQSGSLPGRKPGERSMPQTRSFSPQLQFARAYPRPDSNLHRRSHCPRQSVSHNTPLVIASTAYERGQRERDSLRREKLHFTERRTPTVFLNASAGRTRLPKMPEAGPRDRLPRSSLSEPMYGPREDNVRLPAAFLGMGINRQSI